MTDEEIAPLSLTEDAETGDRFILYTKADGYAFELRFDGGEPWATQEQIGQLFGISRSVATKHIKNVLEDGEVDRETTCAYFEHVGETGQNYRTNIYNLDVILAVGYRVRATNQAIMFRRWANQILKQYLLKGFVLDSPRLRDAQRNDHLQELLEEIADIRASEANVWKRTLELVSKCSDYGMMTDDDKQDYFATFQNTMHWAVTSSTAAEIIWQRADASKDNAGLTTFDGIEEGRQPKAEHMKIAKNYYGRDELDRLRMITNLALDFLASQAEQGRLVLVSEYTDKLRELVKLDGRPLIGPDHKGSIGITQAKNKATGELAVYKKRLRLEKEAKGAHVIGKLLDEARRLQAEKKAAAIKKSAKKK